METLRFAALGITGLLAFVSPTLAYVFFGIYISLAIYTVKQGLL